MKFDPKPTPIEIDPAKIRAKEICDQKQHVEQMKLVKLEIEQMFRGGKGDSVTT